MPRPVLATSSLFLGPILTGYCDFHLLLHIRIALVTSMVERVELFAAVRTTAVKYVVHKFPSCKCCGPLLPSTTGRWTAEGC